MTRYTLNELSDLSVEELQDLLSSPITQYYKLINRWSVDALKFVLLSGVEIVLHNPELSWLSYTRFSEETFYRKIAFANYIDDISEDFSRVLAGWIYWLALDRADTFYEPEYQKLNKVVAYCSKDHSVMEANIIDVTDWNETVKWCEKHIDLSKYEVKSMHRISDKIMQVKVTELEESYDDDIIIFLFTDMRSNV